MAKDVRERMVAGATRLLATKGLQATSFSEVIELTSTPRGSIYHHFPGGKDELVLAALQESCTIVLDGLGKAEGQDAAVVLDTLVTGWRELLERSEYSMGCAAVAVTVATDNDELLEAAGQVFHDWEGRLTELYTAGGLSVQDAADFAAHSLATIEGAVILSRAERSIAVFDRAVRVLPRLLEALR
ncbi:TetR/AcrR family transcriptional regulator [Luteococcus peritonei]|uniref:TetR/AcrR family transcriptional regulator n=1 Tax=Luteococcus peritonei TaxID=88874 RepID=A0ABW4RXX4_9ACTN